MAGLQLPTITQRIAVDDSALGRMGGAFGKVGAVLGKAVVAGAAAATVAVGAFAIKGTADAATVEKGLREVNSLFGRTGPAAEETFNKMRGAVADLSNEVGVAQDVLVGGLYQAISAGVPEDNAFEFMRVASKAAIAGVTDTETAVDGLSTIINAFGLESSDAQAVADSMFATVQGGKTTFAELSASIFNIGPAAAAAGVSFKEVNAAIATLTASGTPTSVATTQLRAALTGLQRPSAELDSIFGKLGYKNAQVAIEAKGMGFALDAVKDASGGSNGELQKLLGSVEAVAAANVIAGTGADKFAGELDRQKGSAGAASTAFEEMQKSTSVQWDKLKVQVQNVGITIGAAILPHLSKIVSWASENLPAWIDRFKSAFKTVAEAAAPIIDAVKRVIDGFSGLGEGGPVGGIIDTFLGLVSSVRDTFAEVFGEGSGVRGQLQGALDAIGPIMTSIGNIIKGALEIITWLWEAVGDDILRFVVASFGAIVKIIKGVMRVIQGIIDVVMGVLTGDWRRAWEGIKNIVGGLLDVIKGVIGRAWAAIKLVFGAALSIIGKAVGGAFGGIVRTIGNAIGAAVAWVKSLPGKAADALGALAGAIGRVASSAMSGLARAISTGITRAVAFVRGLPGKAKAALSAIGSALLSAGGDLIRGLINGITNMASAVADKAREVVSGAISAAKSVLGIESPSKVFREIGRFVGKGFIAGLTDETGAIRETTAKLADLVRETFKKAPGNRDAWLRWIRAEREDLLAVAHNRDEIAGRLERARGRLQSAIETRADFARSVRDTLLGSVTELASDDEEVPTTAASINKELAARLRGVRRFKRDLAELARRGVNRRALQELAAAGVESGGAMASALARGSGAQLEQFNEMQAALGRTAKSTGKQISGELFSAGVNAARGVVEGLRRNQRAIEDQLMRLAKGMQNAIRRALGIRSPSRVFEGIGALTGEGLVRGLLGSRRAVADAAAALAAGMAPVTSGALDTRAGALRRGAPSTAPAATSTTTIAPSYEITTYDPAETARAVREENGWTMALAGRT